MVVIQKKKARILKLRLSNDKKWLIIELEDKSSFAFAPNEDQIKESLLASAVFAGEEEMMNEHGVPELEALNWRELYHLARHFEHEWTMIKSVNSPSLSSRVERAVKRQIRYKVANFVCLSITKTDFSNGNVQRTIMGLINNNPVMIKADTLKNCVGKLVDKIKNEYQNKSMFDLKKEVSNG